MKSFKYYFLVLKRKKSKNNQVDKFKPPLFYFTESLKKIIRRLAYLGNLINFARSLKNTLLFQLVKNFIVLFYILLKYNLVLI